MQRGGGLLLLIWVGAIGLMAGVSRAPEPGGAREFTIDELVERALRENPELQAAHAEVEAAWKNLQVVRQTYELGRHPLLDVIAE